MENTAHSFTEAAEYNPEDAQPQAKKFGVRDLVLQNLELALVLSILTELHNREIEGDETITQKEWNRAIKRANEVLENL